MKRPCPSASRSLAQDWVWTSVLPSPRLHPYPVRLAIRRLWPSGLSCSKRSRGTFPTSCKPSRAFPRKPSSPYQIQRQIRSPMPLHWELWSPSSANISPGKMLDQSCFDQPIQADPTDANGKYDDRAEIQLSPAELVDARKAIIPLALVLLCALPELASANSTSSADIPGPMTKAEIADELHKLVALWPDGNPPRAALRRVNEYLMSEGRRGGG